MLTSLYIKNYALIDELTVEFESGLNIITGETGAGKSILIDAVGLILGSRASVDEVRKGADKAIVEGIFNVAGIEKVEQLFQSNNLDWNGGKLIVRREVSSKGQSRCFLNDSPVSLSLLANAGDLLVDLHGQHDHQSLLKTETHIELLDGFGNLEKLRNEVAESFRRLDGLMRDLNELRRRESELRQRRDLNEFQLHEIDQVSLHAGEEEELESESKILENAEKLFQSTSQIYSILYENENSLHDQIDIVRSQLEDLSHIDHGFEEKLNDCHTAAVLLDELSKFLKQYNSRIEFNPERLEEIRTRLGHIALLKKKYGGTIDTILSHREKLKGELTLAENFEEELIRIKARIEEERSSFSSLAKQLSENRNEIAKKVKKAIADELAELGIASAIFDVHIDQSLDADGYVKLGQKMFAATSKGIDNVEFYISTNAGEDPKPLAKVASGGEISRVMLAMKSTLAKSDRLPLLIFDEIDSGISGRIAQAVGKSLKSLSEFHQILCITHLPQIAGFADVHYAVEKMSDGKRTVSTIKKLNVDQRIREVAKLISGSDVTDAGLESARELMNIR